MGEFLPFWLTSESMYEVHIVTAKKRISMVMPAGQPTHATELGRPSTPAPMMAVMTCPLACHQFPDATTATTWLQMRGVFLQQLARHGKGHVRFALVQPAPVLQQCAALIGAALVKWDVRAAS